MIALKTIGLRWYFGGGSHIGQWGTQNPWVNIYEPVFIFGATIIGGLEYTFSDIPINISMDLRPKYNFIGEKVFWVYGGISARYVFPLSPEELRKWD